MPHKQNENSFPVKITAKKDDTIVKHCIHLVLLRNGLIIFEKQSQQFFSVKVTVHEFLLDGVLVT